MARWLTAMLVASCFTLALPALAALPPGLQGDQVVSWDFSQGAQGWYAAHGTKVSVAGNELVVDCTGPDPYIEGPKEAPFTGDEGQFIVFRARSAKSGTAEFFWADEEGFKAGKEVGFQMQAGPARTYFVFPFWGGNLKQLRFDPADVPGQKVWIESIAVVSLPTGAAPAEPVWDFTRDTQGWAPQGSLADFRQDPEQGLIATSPAGGEGPTLLSPKLDIAAAEARYLWLRGKMSGARRIIVWYTTAEKPGFDVRRFLIVEPPVADPAGEALAVDMTGAPGWTGHISRLRLQFDWAGPDPGVAPGVALASAGLGPRPQGAPAFTCRIVRAPAVMVEGEPANMLVRVQNVGGEPLQPDVTAGGSRYWRHADPGELAPGQAVDLPFRLEPGVARIAPVQARASHEELDLHALAAAPALTSRPPRPEPAPSSRPRALRVGDNFWLIGPRAAACVVKNPYGCGPVFLFRRVGDAWRRVGVLAPALVEGANGGPAQVFGDRAEISGASLTISGPAGEKGRGLAGRVTTRLSLAPDGLLSVDSSLQTTKAGGLRQFRPTTVLAGDGSFGADFAEAIFPGLEEMTAGERSSSIDDATPPIDLRYAPHPHRITMPLMAVSSKQGDVLSLMWQMTPDVAKVGPAATFAVPNWLAHQDNSLMSLSLPAIPEYTAENTLSAQKPYPLKAGQTLRVQGAVYIGQGEVLNAVRAWWAHYGTPALPPLVRSYPQEVAFILRGYEQTCRVPGQGWKVGLGWTTAKARTPDIALHYLLGEQVLGKNAPYPKLRETALGELQGGTNLDLAVHTGDLAQGLLALRAQAYGFMAGQGADGGWGFEPDKNREILGPKGRREVGFAANQISVMLRAAHILGDPALLAAGKKGLAFLDGFRIPRAAQCWEVPVHTPDILAAGYACRAYLAGYKATGDKAYLRKAVYWAETGVPYQYYWQAAGKGLEPMNGGGIPVLGATFFTGSWFGRIVQWCCLDYAVALQDLAPYDKTYPWRHIAEAITRSAMTQQRKEKQYYGMYPDNVGMIDGDVCWGAMLNPSRIADNVFMLMGRDPAAQVATVPVVGGKAAVVHAGTAQVTAAGEGSLQLTLSYPAGYSSYLGIVGVAPGAAVTLDGKPVTADYNPGLALLTVQVPGGTAHVRFTGLRAAGAAAPVTKWTFEQGPSGWIAVHDLQPLTVKGGALQGIITGGDPFMNTGVPGIDTARYRHLRIVMQAPRSGDAEVFFSAATPESAQNSVKLPVTAGEQFREYVVDMGRNPNWQGKLAGLRIDPPGEVGDTVQIREVELLP